MIKRFFTTLLLTASLLGAVAQNANDPVVFKLMGRIYTSPNL